MRDLTRSREKEGWGSCQPAVAAQDLHARRQDVLRAGQHPLMAVDLAVQQGLQGRRRAGAGQLGRVRRRRSHAQEGGQDSVRASASSPGRQSAMANELMAAIVGPEKFLKVWKDKDEDGGRRPRHREGLQGADDVAQAMPTKLDRTELERDDRHGHQRPGRGADHGRLGAGRVPGRRPGSRQGLHLPAGPRPEPVIATGGDIFFFPKATIRRSSAAQETLASVMCQPSHPGHFQPQEGFAPVRDDVDLSLPPMTA